MKFGMAEQRIGCRRLLDEDVERRARDMAAVERGAQRRLVDEAAARAIDDAHALLGLGEVFGRQDVAGLRRQRRVQGDEVGAGEQIVELDLLDADLGGALGAEERIVGDDPHLQADARARRRSSRCCRSR